MKYLISILMAAFLLGCKDQTALPVINPVMRHNEAFVSNGDTMFLSWEGSYTVWDYTHCHGHISVTYDSSTQIRCNVFDPYAPHPHFSVMKFFKPVDSLEKVIDSLKLELKKSTAVGKEYLTTAIWYGDSKHLDTTMWQWHHIPSTGKK